MMKSHVFASEFQHFQEKKKKSELYTYPDLAVQLF